MKFRRNRTLSLLLIGAVLTASCAHRDLKAPCTNTLNLTDAAIVPCDQREPVNGVPSHWNPSP